MAEQTSPMSGYVTKQITVIAVVVSLVIGFLAGVLYSSITSTDQVTVAPRGQAPQGQGQRGPAQMSTEMTPEQASKIMALEQAVSSNPNDGNAWSQLGHTYFDTRRYEQAIKAYNKSLAIRPDDPNILTDLGVMYRATNQFPQAIASFEKANAINPRHEQSLFNRGIVYFFDLKDSAKAIQSWEQLLAVNPNAMASDGTPVKEIISRAQQGTLLPQ